MVAVALLLSTIRPIAPMPAVLPTYHLECSAGEMSGVRARFELKASGQGAARTGEVRIDDMTVQMSVEAGPIALHEAVGGAGFTDMFRYLRGDVQEYVYLRVRGDITDDLIMVALHRQPATPPHSPSYYLTGACRLAGRALHAEREL